MTSSGLNHDKPALQPDITSVLITYLDFYINGDGNDARPVIRVFGRDKCAESWLLHIHGFYPFVLFELPTTPNFNVKQVEQIINSKFTDTVVEVVLIDKIPFYGYHEKTSKFVKIILNNPNIVPAVSRLLLNGDVGGMIIQPYEVHITYLMHFLADFNLSGMDLISLKSLKLNLRTLEADKSRLIPDWNFSSKDPTRHSNSCKFEADCHINDILKKDSKDSSSEIPSLQDWIRDANQFVQSFSPTPEYMSQKPDYGELVLDSEANDLNLKKLRKWVKDEKPHNPKAKPEPLTASQELLVKEEVVESSQELEELLTDWQNLEQQVGSQDLKKASELDPGIEENEVINLDYSSASDSDVEKEAEEAQNGGWKMLSSLKQNSYSSSRFEIRPKPSLKRKKHISKQFPRFVAPIEPPPHPKLFKHKKNVIRSKVNSVDFQSGTPESDCAVEMNLEDAEQSLPAVGMAIEIFARSKKGLHSNPERDPVLVVSISVNENFVMPSETKFKTFSLVLGQNCRTELDIFKEVVRIVTKFDPDFLVGYEIQKESLGYMIRRSSVIGFTLFSRLLSRVPFGVQDRRHCKDEWGDRAHSGFWLPGRHVLNLWRILRKELNLHNYSIEKVAIEKLNLRLPKYTKGDLQKRFQDPKKRHLVVAHLERRCEVTFKIINKLELILRTAQMTKFIGTDFFSVLTRGSQYRVEGVMSRIAKRQGYFLPSPSKDQVKKQNALEEIALTLEPMTKFYNDPVGVLDFRSLYPSVIIAFNLCYSTFIGKLTSQKDGYPFKRRMGTFMMKTQYSKEFIDYLVSNNLLFIAPNGTVFVKPEVRQGLLPTMLKEILEVRILIKSAMQKIKMMRNKPNVDAVKVKNLLSLFDARQYSLKMIANVTYGYTSASFSGRMPCAEIADTIVCIGRRSLQKCMSTINSASESRWKGGRVVYGDTDSVFIEFPSISVPDAFQVSRQIALELSLNFPNPMMLQFEKVYSRCFLVAKKRYCGAIFEKEDDYLKFEKQRGKRKQLKLEAKGLEIVRRDNCPLVGNIMKALVLELFETDSLDDLHDLFSKRIAEIISHKVSIKDFIVSSKVRLSFSWKTKSIISGYRGNTPPPSAVVALKEMKLDAMNYPLYKQRIPYVVIAGLKSVRLVDKVCSPSYDSKINFDYYVANKILPPLERVFSLAGVDVFVWWNKCSKVPFAKPVPFPATIERKKSEVLLRFLDTNVCPLCFRKTRDKLCGDCAHEPVASKLCLAIKQRIVQKVAAKHWLLCESFCDPGAGGNCVNSECTHYYLRNRSMAACPTASW